MRHALGIDRELLHKRGPGARGVAAIHRDRILAAVRVAVIVLQPQAICCAGDQPGAAAVPAPVRLADVEGDRDPLVPSPSRCQGRRGSLPCVLAASVHSFHEGHHIHLQNVPAPREDGLLTAQHANLLCCSEVQRQMTRLQGHRSCRDRSGRIAPQEPRTKMGEIHGHRIHN